ncbi:MAG: hypothetical protein COB36_08790 [Alphaproteobacteria bacterium]|nr:MAG: hypothetical protein COB36_08790 [Alphaproteobacteria bacterium]
MSDEIVADTTDPPDHVDVSGEGDTDPRVRRAYTKGQKVAEDVGKRTASGEEYTELIRKIDPIINVMLKRAFKGASSDIGYNSRINGKMISAKNQVIGAHLKDSDAPAEMDTKAELNEYIRSGELDRRTLDKIINVRPELEGFSLEDAMDLVSDGDVSLEVRQKYSDANSEILLGVACTMLDNNEEALMADHARFYLDHRSVDFAEMAGVNIFYALDDNQTYKDWESERRSEITECIATSPEIMSCLNTIRSGNNVNSMEEAVEQYDLRSTIAKGIADIYSEVYGLETFNRDDVSVNHKSLADFRRENVNGVAWSTEAGIKGDEAVMLYHNPFQRLMVGSNPENTNEEARTNFLSTVVEEMQHTADKIYGDKLVNGDISADHPAYDHSTVILLNAMNFTTPSMDREGYEMQHIERTAKAVAKDVTTDVVRVLETTGVPEKPEVIAETIAPEAMETLEISAVAAPVDAPKI